MSELIAEARVLVTPDTTTFRPLLVQQLAAITRAIPPVPVQVAPVVTGAAGTAALSAAQVELTAATATANTAIRSQQQAVTALSTQELAGARASASAAAAARTEAAARREAAAATLAHQRALSQLTRGAGASALTFAGLRGATLAATGPFLAGTAAVIGLSKALGDATSFNSEIAVLGATTGATGEQLETAAAAAREFGRDITLPGVTAGDAAKTITEFAKAGLSLNQSIAATRGGLQLAQAAQLSYEDAVTLSANALNAFNLSGNEAVRVADTLANSANLAQGGIEETALALRQSAAAAQVVGVTFEDTVALLTLLARNGLTGSDAGTALRTSFLRLVNPSKEAAEILRDLNVQLRDANGNVRPEVFADFADAQRNLAVSTQQANAAIVFGQDAFRAFGILGQESVDGLRQVQTSLDETGTASRIAGARMTGLRGSAENLSNQLGSLGLTIGEKATPAVQFFVDELAEVAEAANAAIDGIEDLKKALEDLPGGPSEGEVSRTFGFLRDSFVEGLELTQPAFRFIKAFKDGADDTSDAAAGAGAEIRSAIEDAGRNAARGATGFGDQITRALDDAFGRVSATMAQAQRNLRAATIRSIGQAGGQAAGLAEQFNAILAGGGTLQEQIASLQRQAQVQATIIRRAGPDAAGVVLEARRAAQSELARINQQIVSLEGQIASEQKQAQDEANRVREEAQRERDRSFLQAQEDARSRQERRITFAEDTPALTDDIRRQTELQALIRRQIEALKQSAVEEKTKQAAIRALKAQRDQTADELRRLRAANNALQAEQRQEARDQISENLDLRTQIAEARGNEDAVLVALNNQIKDQRKRVAAYKKGTTEFLKEKLALEQMLEKRRELLDTAEEGNRGLTAFDILKQNAETFAATGGNLVTGNQPFAGPTGFTADVAQFLHRATGPTAAVVEMKPGKTPLQLNDDRLVRALDRVAAALEGSSGNASTSGLTDAAVDALGARGTAMARFYTSRQARQITEAENP